MMVITQTWIYLPHPKWSTPRPMRSRQLWKEPNSSIKHILLWTCKMSQIDGEIKILQGHVLKKFKKISRLQSHKLKTQTQGAVRWPLKARETIDLKIRMSWFWTRRLVLWCKKRLWVQLKKVPYWLKNRTRKLLTFWNQVGLLKMKISNSKTSRKNPSL